MAGAIDKINGLINSKQNFLLSGGAGSGKTYTLMQVLDKIFDLDSRANVACITYTNVAVEEIESRSNHQNLTVSTIHDFLWDNIKGFQKNLAIALIALIDAEKIKEKTGIKYDGPDISLESFFDKKIQYKEYRKIEEGIISHDDVLKISNYLFNNYPLLCDFVKDRYNFILIDEYQDSEERVLDIFLGAMQKPTTKKNVIGLFGDSMQSIYDGIGDVKKYVDAGILTEVIKEDNYRCSVNVINLLNKIRTDISQKPSAKNRSGTASFIYSQSETLDIAKIKSHPTFTGWDFIDVENTKELYLTHKLIAKEKGFFDLLDAYEYSDRLVGDNKDKLAKHLFKVQEIIYLYDAKKYNEFIKKTEFKLTKLSDKKTLKDKIEILKNVEDRKIGEIVALADSLNLVKKDDNFNEYLETKSEQYDKIKDLPYGQLVRLYEYELGFSPYSTQHGVKGAEFKNVFVILDNGRWSKYNFSYLFENTKTKESIIERTRKIFYVCCSRAEDNLVVFFHKPSATALGKAKEWFGPDNVYQI